MKFKPEEAFPRQLVGWLAGCRAVADSGIPRGEVFITTKLWRADWGYEKAKAAVAASLQVRAGCASPLPAVVFAPSW